MANMSHISTNSPHAWILAARPKTLTGAAVPVMIGISAAWADGFFRPVPALLCFLFAFFMQIDANFINDYYDFRKGLDDEKRLGPKRACAEGWITLPAMRRGIICTTLLSCLTGLPLVWYGGWTMVLIGVCCVVFCFLYTTCMARLGLGDLLVLVFFGLVPVGATYYLQSGTVVPEVWTLSLACGLVIDCLLVVNNYRDRDNDKAGGKITLVVRIGEKPQKIFIFGSALRLWGLPDDVALGKTCGRSPSGVLSHTACRHLETHDGTQARPGTERRIRRNGTQHLPVRGIAFHRIIHLTP